MKIPVAQCPHGAADLPGGRKPAVSPKSACESCGETAELRVCQTCGHVGCCESHNGHDTEHFEKTGHPLIRPRAKRRWFARERGWLWCYLCRAYLE